MTFNEADYMFVIYQPGTCGNFLTFLCDIIINKTAAPLRLNKLGDAGALKHFNWSSRYGGIPDDRRHVLRVNRGHRLDEIKPYLPNSKVIYIVSDDPRLSNFVMFVKYFYGTSIIKKRQEIPHDDPEVLSIIRGENNGHTKDITKTQGRKITEVFRKINIDCIRDMTWDKLPAESDKVLHINFTDVYRCNPDIIPKLARFIGTDAPDFVYRYLDIYWAAQPTYESFVDLLPE